MPKRISRIHFIAGVEEPARPGCFIGGVTGAVVDHVVNPGEEEVVEQALEVAQRLCEMFAQPGAGLC